MEALSASEARVLGCLVEKAMTTPEYYPMTVNALVAACNQKTNREPVVDYDEAEVEAALAGLDHKGLVVPARGRAAKHAQRAAAALAVDDQQLALLAVLLLRGPQTPGELRSRTDRYEVFADAADVDAVLAGLIDREPPLVERLAREPGQKEHRFRTLLTGGETPPAAPVMAGLEERLTALEARVAALEGRPA